MVRKVVIIDDEPWTRGVVMKLAQWNRLGLEVVGEAADGETGLELIRKVLPDIVITDVRMPRISGIELVQALRAEGFQMPILIISGYDDFAYVRSALKLGVTDYLLKPIKALELNQQLQRCADILNREETARPRAVIEAGLFADGWEKDYYDIRNKLETALKVGNGGIIRRQMARLYEIVREQEGEQPPTAVMVGIYYAMLFTLQKYIDSAGLRREDVFGVKGPTFVFSRDNTLKQLIDFIQERYCDTMRCIEKQQRNRLDIEAVCRYIRTQYDQGITLEQTADEFHATKEYLSKAFKADRNEGFTEYVTSLRMKRAYELIVEFDAPLKDVGAMVGYFDLAHFYKTFKKHFGKTPGEVRESLKKDKTTTP